MESLLEDSLLPHQTLPFCSCSLGSPIDSRWLCICMLIFSLDGDFSKGKCWVFVFSKYLEYSGNSANTCCIYVNNEWMNECHVYSVGQLLGFLQNCMCISLKPYRTQERVCCNPTRTDRHVLGDQCRWYWLPFLLWNSHMKHFILTSSAHEEAVCLWWRILTPVPYTKNLPVYSTSKKGAGGFQGKFKGD